MSWLLIDLVRIQQKGQDELLLVSGANQKAANLE